MEVAEFEKEPKHIPNQHDAHTGSHQAELDKNIVHGMSLAIL
jgi:hypothetical protein